MSRSQTGRRRLNRNRRNPIPLLYRNKMSRTFWRSCPGQASPERPRDGAEIVYNHPSRLHAP